MAQFRCELCGQGFEQLSRLERHKQTSHPERAPDAADLTALLQDISLPKRIHEIRDVVAGKADQALLSMIDLLPDQTIRDSAELARALGEAKRQQAQPTHQPSKKGGAAALESGSVTSMAQLFKGIRFPVNGSELKDYVRHRADADNWEIIKHFQGRTYRDMTEVTAEFGRLKNHPE